MPALLRSASLTDYARVARAAGLDPEALLREAGLPQAALGNPDLKVTVDAVRTLLELSASRSGDEAFGLRMAESRALSNLGAIGLLLREEPTLRKALEAGIKFGRLHNPALLLVIEEAGPVVVIREELIVGNAAPVRQSTELAVGVLFRLLRVFLGPDWEPRTVCFAHAAPKDRALHHRLFGRRVQFLQDFNGVVCNAKDLDAPNPGADPVMARYARQVLEEGLAQGHSVAGDVRQLVFVLLPSGRCSVEAVSQHLGVERRTVHRQLMREGETFSEIVELARRELAARYVEAGRPLTEVSTLLGFSALSAFSRWHRRSFGEAASRARRPEHKLRATV